MDTPNTSAAPAGAHPSGIEVALAMARVRLAETHFRQVMAFIEFTADDLSTPRALGIYSRLHHLTDIEYATIRNRVLASFGENGSEPAPLTSIAADGAVEWRAQTSTFRRIRRRLGGRRNSRLRSRVELFSGRVEAALLDIHVDCVCRIVKHIDPNTSVAEVVRLYMEALGVHRTAYSTIYVGALARLYTELEVSDAATSETVSDADEATMTAEPTGAAESTGIVASDTGRQAGFDPGSAVSDLDIPRPPGADRSRLRIVPGRAL